MRTRNTLLAALTLLLVGSPVIHSRQTSRKSDSLEASVRSIPKEEPDQLKAGVVELSGQERREWERSQRERRERERSWREDRERRERKRSFAEVDADSIKTIQTAEFFFVTSKNSFITQRSNGSPLLESVPSEVGVSGPSSEATLSTLIVQQTGTDAVEGRDLEGRRSRIYIIMLVVGGTLGLSIARQFKKNRVHGAVAGALIAALGAIIILEVLFDANKDEIFLYVDNACGEDAWFILDDLAPVRIKAMTNTYVKFKEGTRSVQIKPSGTGGDTPAEDTVDMFELIAKRYRDPYTKEPRKGYYVYNIQKVNNYTITKASY